MRPIEFRAWDVEKKFMINVCELYWCVGGLKAFGPGIFLAKEWVRDDELIIMQYTGLKDKGGKKIYEGDVVKWTSKSGGGVGAIFWDEEEAQFAHSFLEEDGSVRPSKKLWNVCDDFKVIGNIYENPELLKR